MSRAPFVAVHAITIDTRPVDADHPVLGHVHRWHCSCGYAGEWRGLERGARSARTGGVRHVAAMERSR